MRDVPDIRQKLETIPSFPWRPGGDIHAAFNYVAGYYEDRLDISLDDDEADAIITFLIEQGFGRDQVYRIVETYKNWRKFKSQCLNVQFEGHKEDVLVDVNLLLGSELMTAYRLAVMESVWDTLMRNNMPVYPVDSHPDLDSIVNKASLVSYETAKSEDIAGDHRTMLLMKMCGPENNLKEELASFTPASGRLAITGGHDEDVWYPGLMVVDVHTVEGHPVYTERGVICGGEILQW